MPPSVVTRPVEVPRRQRRPPRSCVGCRQRKIGCNREQPCRHCVASKRACTYSHDSFQTSMLQDIAALAEAPRASSARTPPVPGLDLDQSFSAVERPEHNQLFQISKTIDSTTKNDQTQYAYLATPSSESTTELEELRDRVKVLERLLISRTFDDTDTGNLSNTTNNHYIKDTSHGSPNPSLSLNKSRLFGRSHWSTSSYEFKPIALAMNGEAIPSPGNQATIELKSEITTLLKTCKFLARTLKANRRSISFETIHMSLLSNGKEFADRMTHLYISRFESVFRIFHVPSLMKDCEKYWTSPAETATPLRLKIELVIALGISLCSDTSNAAEDRSAACQLLHNAHMWLVGPVEKNRLTIEALQVQCLLILARQILSFGGDLIWVSMGNLLRAAMQLGLHRDPKHFRGLSVLQIEVRRRLWATIMELNLHASLDSGMAPCVSIHDFDTESPSNVNDIDIDDQTSMLKQYAAGQTTDTSLQRHLFHGLRPRLEILNRMNGLGIGLSQNEVLALTSDLNRACSECSLHVHRTDHVEVDIFKYNLADLFLRRFLLCLHRPLASRAREDPTFYHSRKICLDSAMALLSPTANQEFFHIMLAGGGLFKNRIIHAVLALALELLYEMDEHKIQFRMSTLSSYKQMLIDGLKEARQQLVQRIQLGETNIRLHMKLSVILCRAESTATGLALQESMMQSATESLKTSCAILQALAYTSASDIEPMDDTILEQNFDLADFTLGFDLDELFYAGDSGNDQRFHLSRN